MSKRTVPISRCPVPAPVLVAGLLMTLAVGPVRAQGVPPPVAPAPFVTPAPLLPSWTPRLAFHAGGGVLQHRLDPSGDRAFTLLLAGSYTLDRWAAFELELQTATLSGAYVCPALIVEVCEPEPEDNRLVTLLYGVRLATPTAPIRGSFAFRSGLELGGVYEVFELGLGGAVDLGPRLAVRLEARSRWDYAFGARGPIPGTSVLLGLTAKGR